jgi:hypothetical protein
MSSSKAQSPSRRSSKSDESCSQIDSSGWLKYFRNVGSYYDNDWHGARRIWADTEQPTNQRAGVSSVIARSSLVGQLLQADSVILLS